MSNEAPVIYMTRINRNDEMVLLLDNGAVSLGLGLVGFTREVFDTMSAYVDTTPRIESVGTALHILHIVTAFGHVKYILEETPAVKEARKDLPAKIARARWFAVVSAEHCKYLCDVWDFVGIGQPRGDKHTVGIDDAGWKRLMSAEDDSPVTAFGKGCTDGTVAIAYVNVKGIRYRAFRSIPAISTGNPDPIVPTTYENVPHRRDLTAIVQDLDYMSAADLGRQSPWTISRIAHLAASILRPDEVDEFLRDCAAYAEELERQE